MSKFIPSDEVVRQRYVEYPTLSAGMPVPEWLIGTRDLVEVEAFDRWLTQVRAVAWDEGAEFMDSDHFWHDNGRGHNPYANRMEDGE